MALSNAERQKRYRETRKEKVSELETLRNEIKLLQSQLQLTAYARDNFSNHNHQLVSEVEKLRNDNYQLRKENQELRASRKKTRKLVELLTEETAFFYVQDGIIKLLQWPETIGTVNAKGLDLVPYAKIDKKYRKTIDNLILEYNRQATELNKSFSDAP